MLEMEMCLGLSPQFQYLYWDDLQTTRYSFSTPIIWPGFTPGRYGSIIIVKVNPTSIILRPAIKLP